MFFKRVSGRKSWGMVVIVISIFLLLTTFFSSFPGSLPYLDAHQDLVAISSFAALITGAYLVAGPLGALVALIPAVAAGCFGGDGKKPKPEPDLGEPPGPPEE